ncbi:hypothetical protein F4811DRAFT_176510 [Daldinia bambusicola]|nr:hypothetical protein F4811DRAFT_176510 [Daldinia bambusicola]
MGSSSDKNSDSSSSVQNSKLIFSASFSSLRDSVIDLSSVATIFRHRLIDMNAFLNDRRLDIYEYPSSLTSDRYVAVSYVWRGNPLVTDPSSPSYWVEELGTFNVKGAETGDPISLDVLYHVCSAALSCSYSGSHLWLDRLCILQSSKKDKAWQIRRMHDIYKHSKICCILPGGIQRLVSLDEETAWIERAWTLQEALLPWRAIVLFLADEDRLEQLDNARKKNAIPSFVTEIFPGLSAYGELRPLLQLSMTGATSIFGRRRAPISALYGAVVQQNTHSFIEKDMKMQMIWFCALMRTSSRPVDMVFSIMGLIGVDLDPLQFDKNDRVKATIALASKSISYIGTKANWLAAAYQLEPCRQISSFPLFPKTSVDGQAFYGNADLPPPYRSSTTGGKLLADVVEERCDFNCWLSGLPEGEMDEDGYLTFCSKAVKLVPILVEATISIEVHIRNASNTKEPRSGKATSEDYVRAEDGTIWRVSNDTKGENDTSAACAMAVFLGTQMGGAMGDFNKEGSEGDSDDDDLDWRERWSAERIRRRRTDIALLVQEHSPGRFNRISYFKVKGGFDNKFPDSREMTISLGGPN